MLGSCQKIVEHALFLGEVAGQMPLLAKFALPAAIGNDQYAALLEPEAVGPEEVGTDTNAVAAVADEQCRIVAVQPNALPSDDVERHGRAISGPRRLANHLHAGPVLGRTR